MIENMFLSLEGFSLRTYVHFILIYSNSNLKRNISGLQSEKHTKLRNKII